MKQNIVLGGGITGLSAGISTGWPIYEALSYPGGICSSYYVTPGDCTKWIHRPKEPCYRFEFGGGHWIFGADPVVEQFLSKFSSLNRCSRISSVQLNGGRVPYPLQNNLHALTAVPAKLALSEMVNSPTIKNTETMDRFFRDVFGKTLCELFFDPFHELYTSGLYRKILPQDPQKSPTDIRKVISGIFGEETNSGYNTTFLYSPEGLDILVENMAKLCKIQYESVVDSIDLREKCLHLITGEVVKFDNCISTLPLNTMIRLCGDVFKSNFKVPDPCTSVQVLNIGGKKGKNCPKDHWIYFPESNSGFHRVGFYSNVSEDYAPPGCVSIYVETSYPYNKDGENLTDVATPFEIASKGTDINRVVIELIRLGFIESAEVVSRSFVPVAYTWSWSPSVAKVEGNWKEDAIKFLRDKSIYQAGRYGRWSFQGIAESVKEGLLLGSLLRS